jgi:hypothetical protein
MAMGLGSAQAASDMVVVGYGGAGQSPGCGVLPAVQRPGQSKVIQSEYNGEMARIKVMVDTGNVDWDVVQIEGPDLMRGCDEGMYERLDWTRLGHADQLIPEAAQECGSAALVWSVAIAYDPTSWPRPHLLGGFLGRAENPRQARPAQARGVQPGVRLAGRRGQGRGRVQGAQYPQAWTGRSPS